MEIIGNSAMAANMLGLQDVLVCPISVSRPNKAASCIAVFICVTALVAYDVTKAEVTVGLVGR